MTDIPRQALWLVDKERGNGMPLTLKCSNSTS